MKRRYEIKDSQRNNYKVFIYDNSSCYIFKKKDIKFPRLAIWKIRKANKPSKNFSDSIRSM